jgi:hypothetical protein
MDIQKLQVEELEERIAPSITTLLVNGGRKAAGQATGRGSRRRP